MTRWEYMEMRPCNIEDMNDLGNEGWELAAARYQEAEPAYNMRGYWHCVFKRPKLGEGVSP